MRIPAISRRKALRIAAIGTAAFVVTGSLGTWLMFRSLDGNIRTDTTAARSLAGSDRPPAGPPGTQNILVIGSDDRSAPDGRYGNATPGSVRSDTVMLIHLSERQKRAEVVNIPRDLLVYTPRCKSRSGEWVQEQRTQFNWTFETGGTACTVRTFEKLTNIRADHHMVVDFAGFKKIVNAVGGVEVDLPEAEEDPNVGLDVPAGRQVLRDEDALAYVRARVHVGDGSDANRIRRQHEFLGLLADKVKDKGTLSDPRKLHAILKAATSSLTTDPGLNSVSELYALAEKFREIPEDRIAFRSTPSMIYPEDPNRLITREPQAQQLFAALRTDRRAASRA
ncbi:LytR family transcriptional regulator [Streptomyces sp. A7024]|uniref:LytR family transcriptional regulator n=1 Tax=Streptomyces coryli TaxID=1128680 RepID=A0A6G4U1B9_9ACTN|nr:LCP family protein [Streptomyces coryli]NGN65077.1 LytR family transcriptional regulator [Streptomyces coryli]